MNVRMEVYETGDEDVWKNNAVCVFDLAVDTPADAFSIFHAALLAITSPATPRVVLNDR